jgi:hypothetical protein
VEMAQRASIAYADPVSMPSAKADTFDNCAVSAIAYKSSQTPTSSIVRPAP